MNTIFNALAAVYDYFHEENNQPQQQEIPLPYIPPNLFERQQQPLLFIEDEDELNLEDLLQAERELDEQTDHPALIRRIEDGGTITEQEARSLYRYLTSQPTKFLVRIRSQGQAQPEFITVSEKSEDFLIDLFTQRVNADREAVYGSDTLDNYNFENIEEIGITPIQPRANQEGEGFKYFNTSPIDLRRYQIYKQSERQSRKQCLIFALEQLNISEAQLNDIILAIPEGASICVKHVKQIAKILDRGLIVHKYDQNNNIRYLKYNLKSGEPLNIALYENHYFIYEETEYSRKLIKDNEFNLKFHKNNKDKMTSLELVRTLHLNDYFKKAHMDKVESTQINPILDNLDNEQRPYEYKPKEDLNASIFYADCESFVYKNPHALYLIGVVSDKSDDTKIFNVCNHTTNEQYSKEQKTVFNFLNHLTKNKDPETDSIIVYFHNLKYDYLLLCKYLNIRKIIEKDNQIYSVEISYKNTKIVLKDSFKLLSMRLSSLPSTFNLPKEMTKKEAIAYTYYTPERDNQRITKEEYKKYLKPEEHKIFDENVTTPTFNPTEYYRYYLKYDCLVLKYGIQKFREIMLNITKLDIHNYLTVSSIADHYFASKGAYENVYEVRGNLREYISKAVYGGRVCVNKKYQKTIIQQKIADFDGVSLYPSAIFRIGEETDFARGKILRLPQHNLEIWKESQYAILTVNITKVNKCQQLPFIAVKTDAGTQYTNKPPKHPIIIDKLTLEDYIKFHEIEYTIIDGIYIPKQPTHPSKKVVKSTIHDLFTERLQVKSTNVPLANTIKLILNSIYGKTILKKSKSKTSIIKRVIKYKENDEWLERDNFIEYVTKNYSSIKHIKHLNSTQMKVTSEIPDNSYNRATVGCMILSMSKRIMNEVFDTANSSEIPIYYQDTDSMHLPYDEVPNLAEKYKEQYNKQLIGKQLCQFHIDFDLRGAASEVYATKSIFLGKKSYIDVLESTNSNNEKIQGYHYRLKGITKEGLQHEADKYEDKYLGLFTDLSNGKKIDFVLNPPGKVLFEFNDDSITTKNEFIRSVKF